MMYKTLAQNGVAIAPQIFSSTEIQTLINVTETLVNSNSPYGIRNILDKSPIIKKLVSSDTLLNLVKPVLGNKIQIVRAIYFDKVPKANWYVTWHQDVTIAVLEKYEVSGYSAWSYKENIWHVQPPVNILENMLTLRIHLDKANEDNGVLEVIYGSHKMGRLDQTQEEKILKENDPSLCICEAGDILLMHPLILHASKKSKNPLHRRVIHIEYAGIELDKPLQWIYSKEV